MWSGTSSRGQGDELEREEREVALHAVRHHDRVYGGPPAPDPRTSAEMASTAIVWFRRDLRVHDHPALRDASQSFDRVLPVFVLDDRLLHGRFASGPRTAFMLGCLRDLDASLRDRGAALHVAEGRPEDVLPALAAEAGAERGAVDERRLAVRPRARRARDGGAARGGRRGPSARRHLHRRDREGADQGRRALRRLLAVLPGMEGGTATGGRRRAAQARVAAERLRRGVAVPQGR